MPEQSHGPSDLHERLSELDRRLSEIQAALLPERTPPPAACAVGAPAAVPAAAAGAPGPVPAAAHDLGELHGKLLGAVRELLSAIELIVPRAAAGATAGLAARGETDREVAVSAGPFANTEAVREFERAVEAIPGVTDVEVRVYEGENRAIFDVQLA